MPQLKYWVAQCIDDNECYSLVSKTKKGLAEQAAEYGRDLSDYEPPRRLVIDYDDAFDLFQQSTSESGGRASTGRLPRPGE